MGDVLLDLADEHSQRNTFARTARGRAGFASSFVRWHSVGNPEEAQPCLLQLSAGLPSSPRDPGIGKA